MKNWLVWIITTIALFGCVSPGPSPPTESPPSPETIPPAISQQIPEPAHVPEVPPDPGTIPTSDSLPKTAPNVEEEPPASIPLSPPESPVPSMVPLEVDLKVNGSDEPITIPKNGRVILEWTTSGNPGYCSAEESWGDRRGSTGEWETPPLFGPRTFIYTLVCWNEAGSASDSVMVNVLGDPAPAATLPPAPAPARTPSGRMIYTEIIVDTDSFSPSDSELNEFFGVMKNILLDKTGVEMQLQGIRRISYEAIQNRINPTGGTANTDQILTNIYLEENPPEFFVLLRSDSASATYGGYAVSFEQAGFCNRYKDPQDGKTTRVYGGLMDWDHMYSCCGYDASDPQNPVHISDVSIDGECRNRPGTACIYREQVGYYQCNDAESLESFYNQGRYNFLAATSIHELMHHFGEHGNYDHFGTAACDEIMGGTEYDDGTLSAAQRNAVICPALFEVFKDSYREC